MRDIQRHRTAIGRGGELSRPVRFAVETGILTPDRSFFDYGCGRGEDIALLTKMGFTCNGWDPVHRSTKGPHSSEIVNIGYVVNVIEDQIERTATLRKAWALARRWAVDGWVECGPLAFGPRSYHIETGQPRPPTSEAWYIRQLALR